MLRTRTFRLAMMLGAAVILFGRAATNVVGTVGEVRIEKSEIEVKLDYGSAIAVRFTPETAFRKVLPGETDLKNATAIASGELAAGDRVLVTCIPGTAEARRVIVMPAAEIANRNDADRQDWSRRGLAGIVSAKKADQIILRTRSVQGEAQVIGMVGSNTTYRRYAPDSVKFADAKPSSLAEVRAGDQLRARGQKSPDGLSVAADEVVFGTFITKAGAIVAVNLEAREITIKDLETGKPLVIKVAPDSQLKRMPAFGGMPAGGVRRAGGPPAGGPGAGAPAGPGAPDLSQMLERLPAATMEDLKPGESIVVSSAGGHSPGSRSTHSITAIVLLANADLLIRMATMQSDRDQAAGMAPGGPGPASGIGGLSGLEMPGMIP